MVHEYGISGLAVVCGWVGGAAHHLHVSSVPTESLLFLRKLRTLVVDDRRSAARVTLTRTEPETATDGLLRILRTEQWLSPPTIASAAPSPPQQETVHEFVVHREVCAVPRRLLTDDDETSHARQPTSTVVLAFPFPAIRTEHAVYNFLPVCTVWPSPWP